MTIILSRTAAGTGGSVNKLSVRDIDARGRRVFVRVDFNVPLTPDGEVADDTRIRASLPTVNLLREAGARLLLGSHLGRPKGVRVDSLSLAPAARRLGELLEVPVPLAEDCIGEPVERAARDLGESDVLMLENLRFYPGETRNDPDFARRLASPAELYVNDAFGSAHRAHASVSGVPRFLPQAAAGLLLETEIRSLGALVGDRLDRPYVAVLGGAKVADKIPLIEHLLNRVDRLLIGGAMAYTFLRAKGLEIGTSRVEKDSLEQAGALLARSRAGQIVLPADHVQVESLDRPETHSVTTGPTIDPGRLGVDIGPATMAGFAEVISGAGTVLWNGPLGLFETPPFDRGTRTVAEAMVASNAFTVVGGGDSSAAVRSFKLGAGFSHVSTGGGATLEFLSGKALPGLAALSDAGAASAEKPQV